MFFLQAHVFEIWNAEGDATVKPKFAICAWFAALLLAAVILAAVSLTPAPLAAQNGESGAKPPATAQSNVISSNEELQKLYMELPVTKLPTPKSTDGHPDLSGFWYNDLSNASQRDADGSVRFDLGGSRRGKVVWKYPEPSEPEYTPEYAAKVKTIIANQYGETTTDDPNFDCLPSGVPRVATGPLQIVQTPKMIVILYESNFIGQTFRVIYTDGRPHPKDLDTSYLGHSIGHWDGDVLVVDVASLNEETWMGGAQGHTEPGAHVGEPNHQIIEKAALIHSDQEHVTERYTRRGNMLFYEATVEDPVAFTKPWVVTPRHLNLGKPDDELFETFCQSRDKEHIIKPSEKDQYLCNYCKKPASN
jgi:hypothetical protein